MLYGPVEEGEINAKYIKEEMDRLGELETIRLYINSPGGDVFLGQAIYSIFKRHKAQKIVYIDGLAASIASVIAMAGDKVIMPQNAMMMIHNPWTIGFGESKDFRKLADDLDKIRQSIITVYKEKTGLSEEKIIDLMDAETWLTAEEAKEFGFADEIEEAKKIAACLPENFIKKFLNIPKELLEGGEEQQMTKEIRELYAQLEEKENLIKNLINKDESRTEEIEKMTEEIKGLKVRITALEEIEEKEKKEEIKNQGGMKIVDMQQKDYLKEFIDGLRNKFRNGLSVGSNPDGGYTVPEDIRTKVEEYRTSKDALQNFVTVEKVSAPTGERTFKTRAQQTGFVEVSEEGLIPEKATPQFTRLAYAVKKYAGFLKATNELLKDSDAAIVNIITKWIGDESRVTRNKKILDVLGTKSKTAIATADDIKTILNVQLDPAFRYTSVIVTNQDGFNWLDTLKDGQGNYLLQPSAVAPTGKQLFGIPVAIVSNKDLPTTINKAPMFIGDLKEAVVLFDREELNVMASDVAADAYLTDVTLFRAIERFDVKIKDAEAFVYGEVALV